VADVLFGDHDFQGTLSFAWPASASQPKAPLFPLGFGLRHGKGKPVA
jgi:beta-glucosidase